MQELRPGVHPDDARERFVVVTVEVRPGLSAEPIVKFELSRMGNGPETRETVARVVDAMRVDLAMMYGEYDAVKNMAEGTNKYVCRCCTDGRRNRWGSYVSDRRRAGCNGVVEEPIAMRTRRAKRQMS